MHTFSRIFLAAFFSSYILFGFALAGDPKKDAKVRPIVDVRYKTTAVGREDFVERGIAHTLRARIGFEATPLEGVSFLFEGEGVANFNDHFNSTTNGYTQYPTVADAEALEINRGQVAFTLIPKTKITLGRQRINIANQRFIGAVDFRQNQQTFDAARVELKPSENLSAEYVYIDRVHRVFGDANPKGEFNSDSHVARVAYDAKSAGKFSAYTVLLDLKDDANLSSSTWGLRHTNVVPLSRENKGLELSYAVEFARQSDFAANPIDYTANYVLTEGTLSRGRVSFNAGYERLGGDGTIGFSTPLATLHRFQGFADAFKKTPKYGVEDIYAGFSVYRSNVFGVKKIIFSAAGHHFESARGNDVLGQELDLMLAFKFNKHVSAKLKGAVFERQNSGPPGRNYLWFAVRFTI